jgi:hypothetical protein
MIDVLAVYGAEQIEFHPMLLKQAGGPQHLRESSMTASILAKSIVQGLGAIQAQADKKAVFIKKSAPVVVQKNAVPIILSISSLLYLELELCACGADINQMRL